MLFTLADIQGEADFHLLNLDKLFIGPVALKRLRFKPGELSFDQTALIIETNRLFQRARDEAMMTARAKLLKEI